MTLTALVHWRPLAKFAVTHQASLAVGRSIATRIGAGPMILALASPRVASSIEEGLDKIKQSISEAATRGAEIVCFPEAYLPGLRGLDFEVPPFDEAQQERALQGVAQWARTYKVAIIPGMEWLANGGRQIAAVVLDAMGEIQGVQTKNQLDPTEELLYVPGHTRQLFEINGLKFGVAICHEGFRYSPVR